MNAPLQEHRDYGFAIGLFTGTLVGAGLAIWLAPRFGSALRERMSDSARSLRQQVSEQHRQVSAHVGEAVDELTQRGQDVRDDVAEAVARGAHQVERFATSAKSGRT